MAKPAFNLEQAHILRKEYENGSSSTELAKKYGVGDGCIRDWIKKVGGTIRTNSQSKRKYHFDESYFNIIDTEQKAYWLGFFIADGYIGKFNGKWRNFWCTLSAKDGHHLEKFIEHVKCENYTPKYYVRDGHNKVQMILTSIPMVNKLIEIGWLDLKQNGDPRILEYIPDNLMHHFIRGYFDGDGSIGRQKRTDRKSKKYAYNIVIVAHLDHFDFLDKIRQFIVHNVGISDKSLKKSSTVWKCHWNGNRQVKLFGQWLYKSATIYLERKKKRFDELNMSKIPDFIWPRDNRFKYLLTPKEISQLSEEDQNAIICRFCELLNNSNWVPPSYSEEQLISDWRSVLIFNSDLYYHNDGFRLNTGSNLPSPGKRIIEHFQPHFWDVRTTAPTVPERWNDCTITRRAATALLTTGTKISLSRFIREMRYAGAAITSHFHPNFAIAIIMKLAPDIKTWFDPCMGWGGRLMAAKVLDIEYEGCDPQKDTFNGLVSIKDFIGSDALLHNIKAQDFSFDKRYDLGFTSPPFFNKEKYGGEEQSHIEFNRYNLWFTDFLCPLIDRMRENCNYVILHVDSRILDSIEKVYNINKYPIYLQRNPGGPKGKEWIIMFEDCDM